MTLWRQDERTKGRLKRMFTRFRSLQERSRKLDQQAATAQLEAAKLRQELYQAFVESGYTRKTAKKMVSEWRREQ